jgi:uncharacterized protein YdeI (YjbR/CyaY-like superfamily)
MGTAGQAGKISGKAKAAAGAFKGALNPKVDAFLRRAKKWQAELGLLRRIVLDCHLDEGLKWRIPCYTFQGSHVVGINGLKDFCALAFFKGSLLKDAHNLLLKPGENTQAGRWIKFRSVREITALEPLLKAYIQDAKDVERTGLKPAPKKDVPLILAQEFEERMAVLPALKKAFEALTPGRRRAYHLYFSSAKQSKTRLSRVEKCLPQILKGKGMSDR